jgi:hypothetical protein
MNIVNSNHFIGNQVTENSAWFDNLIATLRQHELQLETGTAPDEMINAYKVLMGNNQDEICKLNKQSAQMHFVSRIIYDYLKQLDKNVPIKLAFDFNDSEVLVWAEVGDDDDQLEKALMRAESKINAKFHPYGFDMETMIVETADKLPIPNHYKVFKA